MQKKKLQIISGIIDHFRAAQFLYLTLSFGLFCLLKTTSHSLKTGSLPVECFIILSVINYQIENVSGRAERCPKPKPFITLSSPLKLFAAVSKNIQAIVLM
jgi:uncharacterized membrane protein